MHLNSVRLLAAAALVLPVWTAPADALTWHLREWVFDDGGTAQGLFDYDFTSRQFSNVDVTTFSDTGSVNRVYSAMAPRSGASLLYMIEEPAADLTGTGTMWSQLWGVMYAEGTIDAVGGLKYETTCGNAACSAIGPIERTLVSGVITTDPDYGTAVPEIDASAGLGALAALGGMLAFLRGRRRV